MKRFSANDDARASAMTMAEASFSCGNSMKIFSDAVLLASFFVAAMLVRLCLVAVWVLIIMALLSESRSIREEPQPVVII